MRTVASEVREPTIFDMRDNVNRVESVRAVVESLYPGARLLPSFRLLECMVSRLELPHTKNKQVSLVNIAASLPCGASLMPDNQIFIPYVPASRWPERFPVMLRKASTFLLISWFGVLVMVHATRKVIF